MIFAATGHVLWPLYEPKMRLRLQRSPDPLAGGEGAAPSPAVGLNLAPHFEIVSAATGKT